MEHESANLFFLQFSYMFKDIVHSEKEKVEEKDEKNKLRNEIKDQRTLNQQRDTHEAVKKK